MNDHAFHTEQEELERELRGLPPVVPSHELASRIEAELGGPSRNTVARQSRRPGLSLATAALLLLGAMVCLSRFAQQQQVAQNVAEQPRTVEQPPASSGLHGFYALPSTTEELDAYLDARASRWLTFSSEPVGRDQLTNPDLNTL